MRGARLAICLLALTAWATSGCGAADASSRRPGGGGDGGSGDDAAGSGGSSLSVGGGAGTGAAGAAPPEVAEVFGHSPGTLYRMDPTSKAVAPVGPFQGCTEVVDVAVDKDSSLYGTTDGALYRIDAATAVCTLVARGSYPNSLSFVPAGTVDPDVEALVGYLGSTYVRIDTTSGELTEIGAIGGGYESSGDIVSVSGGKTLLTVTGPGCGDCLVEVDPATGDLLGSYGQLGYGEVFGLAFWAGSAFGFASSGELFEVELDGGVAFATPIAIPDPPPGLEFWGAGSTTSAPPLPVPE